jgi:hypothetical protein
MCVGSARVSTPEQSLALQTYPLQVAGCAPLFAGIVGRAKGDRPGRGTRHVPPWWNARGRVTEQRGLLLTA